MLNLLNAMSEEFVRLYGIAAIYTIFTIAFNVLLMLAIGFDCKARNNKNQVLWMILSFCFPVVVGIVYACCRDKGTNSNAARVCSSCGACVDNTMLYCARCGSILSPQADDDSGREKYQKKSRISLGFSLAALFVSVIIYVILVLSMVSFIGDDFVDYFDDFIYNDLDYNYDYDFDYDYSYRYGYELDGETVFYDRNGNSYDDEDDVLYYDRNSNTYHCDYYESIFITEGGTELDSYYCYLDKDGYLIYDEAGYADSRKAIIYYSDERDGFFDDEGNMYFLAENVSWDKNGNMIDYDGEMLQAE